MSLVSDIQKAIFFAIICDEYTDISNKEHLAICIRWVDDSLVGFIKIPNIMAETIVTAIKDTLARLGLSLEFLPELCSSYGRVGCLFVRTITARYACKDNRMQGPNGTI